jgi:hypothetical protein
MSNDMYPDTPGFKGPADTGSDAAEAMKEHCGRLQQMALAAIRDAGAIGLTADELAARLNVTRWTIQPRTSELRRKHLIVDSRQRRRNVTGKRAIVWTLPEYEQQEAAA